MNHKPMACVALRNLKADKDKNDHDRQINQVISSIYSSSINKATISTDTQYQGQLRQSVIEHGVKPLEFNTVDKAEILCGVQKLFPDCSVKIKSLSIGNDGKMYDISKIDEKILPFINKQQSQEYILIDWS